METKTKITIDMLTSDSVSIKTQTFIEFEGEEKEIGNNHSGYTNRPSGRKRLQDEQPENVVNAVLAVWGDEPTVVNG